VTSTGTAVCSRVIASSLSSIYYKRTCGVSSVISSSRVFIIKVIHFPLLASVRDSAKYTPGINYLLDIN